jgi:hypothetical protein
LALTSPTSGGRSVGIVFSRAQATEFSFCFTAYEAQNTMLPDSSQTTRYQNIGKEREIQVALKPTTCMLKKSWQGNY